MAELLELGSVVRAQVAQASQRALQLGDPNPFQAISELLEHGHHDQAPHRIERQSSRPAAVRIRSAISCGWERRETWLDFSSIVFAFIRFARKRSNSGDVVRSCVETAYQVGLVFHAACRRGRR